MTDDNTSMREVSHTNPNTGRPFGDAVAFRRGAVAADGGERSDGPRSTSDGGSDGGERSEEPRSDGREPETDEEESTETMEDISHTAPDSDNDSAQRTFDRGTEGRDEVV
jgi:hypothetical protein